jgi:hypothetical protein
VENCLTAKGVNMAFKIITLTTKESELSKNCLTAEHFNMTQNMAGQKYLNNRKSITMAQRKTEKTSAF